MNEEEFEAWWTENCDDYSLSTKLISWQAWQASRAALVVQFPRTPYFDIAEIEVECALDKAGVKYEWIDK